MQHRWVVLKFGGTSVSTLARWETIAGVIRERIAEGLRPVVVCSAVTKVSNMIEALLDEAVAGAHEPLLVEIEGKHRSLAAQLGLDADQIVGEELAELRRIALGVSLIHDVGPRVRARTMALGEMMSTKLGEAWLRANGVSSSWCDARDLLTSVRTPNASEQRHFLSAVCDSNRDDELASRLASVPGSALITQGFIARDTDGETVLLGRGGSDTSAALIAGRIGAERLEVWTDVPGMFTANPRQIQSARLLRRLGYEEAQELASTGASVLHPRCIDPVRRHLIPVHIRDSNRPHLQGTVIADDYEEEGAQVKSVAVRKGVTLITMDSLGMWQQVGFLAEVFGVFLRHGLSVGLVATSESNITVSLDASSNSLDRAALRALLEELSEHCEARLISNAASISLVGRNIRSILHLLAPALQAFEEQQLFLLTQSASDVNLSFVMEEEHAESIASKLHALLFGEQTAEGVFGPSWQELDSAEGRADREEAWWRKRAPELLTLVREAGSPIYVYEEGTVRRTAAQIRGLPIDRAFYAMKANWNEEILRVFEEAGLGFECVSPGELAHVRRLFPALSNERLLFTPNFAGASEYVQAFELGAHVTLDNLFPLRAWPEIFRERELIVRIDPGEGDGHHKHVKTAGTYSKFGIPMGELEELVALAAENDVRIVGLHTHVGSGILNPGTWSRNALFLIAQAERYFPEVRILNLGGGLGIAEKPSQLPLDLEAVAEGLRRIKEANPRFELWMEPGRFLVAEAGVLLGRVTQLKQKEGQSYVGVDAGMNSLLRPALYGSFHEIANLSRLEEAATMRADVVGPICESGDVLGHGRLLPPDTAPGDVILLANAGAYGRVMGSSYNLREPAAERFLRGS